MSNKKNYFAVDLGATSGRTIIGSLEQGKFNIEELTRFDNQLIETGGHFYWDIMALYQEVINGLKLVAQRGINIQSIGIDTWGCDFVCVADDGAILRNPLAYRDPHTMGMMEKYFDEKISQEEVYQKTGIQFMNFNSLFQLYAMRQANNAALTHANKILFIPDALSYMLTGNAICEYTVASTSQLLNPMTGDLDLELIESLGLKREQFGPMTDPATIIGTLTEEVQQMTGLKAIPVIAVAGHDTASAVAAVPASNEEFAYLSSGTWSLMGIENKKAIINSQSYDLNFTNEGGIEGTTRFLKNICGMWIYERCRKEWKEEVTANHKDAKALGHTQLIEDAMRQPAFQSIINPDDACFANPPSMTEAIREYCEKTEQHIPQNYGEFCRCIFESLALRYRQVFGWLKDFADVPLNVLHIIGGGSLNQHLNQFTANSCGVTVLAGPQEGTAIGNIMLQAKASGDIKDIWQMRNIIANSIELRRFEPQDQEAWAAAYEKFLKVKK